MATIYVGDHPHRFEVHLYAGDVIYIHADGKIGNQRKTLYNFFVKTKIERVTQDQIFTPFGRFQMYQRKMLNGRETFYIPGEYHPLYWGRNRIMVQDQYEEEQKYMSDQETIIYANWLLQHFDYTRLGIGDELTTLFRIVSKYAE